MGVENDVASGVKAVQADVKAVKDNVNAVVNTVKKDASGLKKLLIAVSIGFNIVFIIALAMMFNNKDPILDKLKADLAQSKTAQTASEKQFNELKVSDAALQKKYDDVVAKMNGAFNQLDRALSIIKQQSEVTIDKRAKEIGGMAPGDALTKFAAPGSADDIQARTKRLGDSITNQLK